MTYDLTKLDNLGDEYEQLQLRLKEVRAGLHHEVLEAHRAGVQQVRIVKGSHYTREAVRTIVKNGSTPAAEK